MGIVSTELHNRGIVSSEKQCRFVWRNTMSSRWSRVAWIKEPYIMLKPSLLTRPLSAVSAPDNFCFSLVNKIIGAWFPGLGETIWQREMRRMAPVAPKCKSKITTYLWLYIASYSISAYVVWSSRSVLPIPTHMTIPPFSLSFGILKLQMQIIWSERERECLCVCDIISHWSDIWFDTIVWIETLDSKN